MAFLDDLDAVPVDLGLDGGQAPSKLFLGGGKAWQLEGVHVPAADRPTAGRLREVWKKRSKGRPSPLIVAATVGDRAHLCGPSGDEPGFHPDVPLQVAERICRSALDEPDYTAAIRFLRTALEEARRKGADDPHARYLLDHLVGENFAVVLADFERLTRMNRDNDGDLVYVSRLKAKEPELQALDAGAEQAPPFVDTSERWTDVSASFQKLASDHDPFDLPPEAIHKAVLETAGSARDVGSITLWKYTAQEALAEVGSWDLVAVVARIAQAYIDGLKGPHQQSANLFAALMRVWARMAVPCLAERHEDGAIKAVRLAETVRRELLRAGYVEGRDFHGSVDVPHPSMADEAFRQIKAPLVKILEEVLTGLESQGLATRGDLKRLRDVLEQAYGQYPTQEVEDRAARVAERKATYTACQRLYGIRTVRSLEDVEAVGVKPLWQRLMALSTDPGEGGAALDLMAQQALAYGVRPERVVL